MSCSCIVIRNSMGLTWDPYLVLKGQTRYSLVKKCKYYLILGEHNDWIMMDFIYKGTYDERYESVHNIVSDGF